MRSFVIATVAALACASAAFAYEKEPANLKASVTLHCKTGVPCGNTCIPKDTVCHVTTLRTPSCKTGKRCGNTCIAANKTCHVATPQVGDGSPVPSESLRVQQHQ